MTTNTTYTSDIIHKELCMQTAHYAGGSGRALYDGKTLLPVAEEILAAIAAAGDEHLDLNRLSKRYIVPRAKRAL